MTAASTCNSKNEIDHNGSQQSNCQDRGTKPVVEAALASHADALRTPMEGEKGVYHSSHGDKGEETGGDLADLVAEVEQTNGETAQDDGEVEPAEKCTFVCEEDFGLDTGGQGNALAWENNQ